MSQNKKTYSEPKDTIIADCFPIVGIGASAGGLEALEDFFRNVKQNSGIAFVIIQHLDPNREDMMPEILQRITPLKVIPVIDGINIDPDCIYIIPPNKSMSILKRKLYLFEPIETRGLRLPIDFFFRSLAEDLGEKSIGIILSGMGSDGTLGVHAIKEVGGVVLVQSQESAKFDSMPVNAMNSTEVDFTGAPNELPEKLIMALNYKLKTTDLLIQNKNTGSLEKIIILLRVQTGHDFSLYKKSTIYRRIERRMGIYQIPKIDLYVKFLQENPKEVEILFKELLIGVTQFFRDKYVWEKLKDEVLPNMIEELADGYAVRAWIPGCSTGEEAYSLAILFKSILEERFLDKKISLQIFATDIDSDAIDKARSGQFPKNITSDIPVKYLSRYFIETETGYLICPEIRETMVFATQSVIKDPPFTKLDIISCRNMLIYLEAEAQKKILSLFDYSLKENGIMILGTSETNLARNGRFTQIDVKAKIYKHSGAAWKDSVKDFPSTFAYTGQKEISKLPLPKTSENNIEQLIEQILIQKYSPPSILVNANGDIIHITGRTGKYLEPAAGKVNVNIFAMARSGLGNELAIGFRKVLQSYDEVLLKNLKIGTEDGIRPVNVTMQRLDKPIGLKDLIIIIFYDLPIISKIKKTKYKTDSKESIVDNEHEQELQHLKEELQGSIEEMQTSKEELISTNEELQSTNEELQSTNEELTTSKEEMQSLNEELQTVNMELQNKVDDFVLVNNDMKNLLNSTDIAILFLDKKLNIRRFTIQTTTLFKMIVNDIGRPFTDIVTSLNYPTIKEDAIDVLKTLRFLEKSVQTFDKEWYSVRIMPYRTLDDHIDGLVLTFTNISIHKKYESALHNCEKNFQRAVDNIVMIVAESDNNLRYKWIKSFDPTHNESDMIGKRDDEIYDAETAKALMILKKEVQTTGKRVSRKIKIPTTAGNIYYNFTASPTKNRDGIVTTAIEVDG